MPAEQLVWQCGISGANPDRFGFWCLSRVLEQPARAVPPSTGRCDPDRSLRPAPSGPRDAPGLPDTDGIDYVDEEGPRHVIRILRISGGGGGCLASLPQLGQFA